ncbi:ABC transporter permease [Ferrovum sp. PN-J185]|uniref:ABC transporter permease n=1 Tax=Ferrovum sp. PN-J185 TaxID=1356306 RepID=UPI00079B6A00|nr:ABC transporter permease [Ferrovum sp. PN-J185]KXW56034.1 inner membrane transport permease YadH [Ferrovum sp. PN-J185]MCC6068254.1 ABC transporter permease [Ferrovum sp. PN-J185]MDE1892311.1 ABC transporter permease [Betaproteobacteria bacterium]MDE2056643.1 ABC transporter permease [Betaproteobacteria bacterium]
MIGFRTLLIKEIMRFWKVSFQTILAPLVSTLLYLVVFAHVLSTHDDVYPGVSYGVFLIPGLMMMAMLQNSFANSSSSLIQSKVTGNLVFVLLTPLSELEFYWAYVVAAMVRGMIVGTVVVLTALFFFKLPFDNPGWILLFGCLSTIIASTLGIIAGIAAEKFDQMAAWQNFIILPLTFLSGAFYSISSLSSPWDVISRFNPFLYMIDGFRYGFFSHSDVSPWFSLFIVGSVCVILLLVTLSILKSGWRLRG